MSGKKYIYAFEEGDGKNKMLLGGKGANLCEMTQIGLNVPPGFRHHHRSLPGLSGEEPPAGRADGRVQAHMTALEKKTGKSFGGATIRCWFRCARVRPCRCRA